jgi:hypothetical protein
MKLSTVLASIKGEQEKTASEQPGAPLAKVGGEKIASAPSATAEKLKAALKEATAAASASTPAAEKTAAATSPIAGLTKLASSVAQAEQEALVKEASLYGAAVCDGFMVRLAQYNEAAEKIASQQIPAATKTAGNADSFEKFAQQNPELVKQAAELGYSSTVNQLEKLAEAAWQKGHDEGTEAIYKAAHSSFVQGYRDTAGLLEALK